MRRALFSILAVVLVAVEVMVYSVPVAEGAALRESYNTGDDNTYAIQKTAWKAMTFKATADYVITSVKILTFKSGAPGTLTGSIRATSSGLPTGADLCSGTTDTSTLPTGSPYEWREITLGGGYALVTGTTYAIVCRTTKDDIDYAGWRTDTSSPTYTDGNGCYSTNSGGAWTTLGGPDLLFETYQMGSCTTVAASGMGWSAMSMNGTIVDPSPTTQYAFVWDTSTKSDPVNAAPASSGYANYYVADEGSYTGNKTYELTNLTSPSIIYYRFAELVAGSTWVYGNELTMEFGVYDPSATSIIGHEIVTDGTNLYYSFESPAATGYVVKIGPEAMNQLAYWTCPDTYFAQGLVWNGTDLIASLYSYTAGQYAKLVTIQTSDMTTVATWTGDSSENAGYFPCADATYGYIPMLSNKVNKILLSNMTEADTYTNAGTNGFTACVLSGTNVYVAGQTTGPPYHPIAIKLDANMDMVGNFIATSASNTFATRVLVVGDYLYMSGGGSTPHAEIWKINISDMTLADSWDKAYTPIPDGSGSWGLIQKGNYLFSVACSAPTGVDQITISGMDTVGSWTAPTGEDGGDCILSLGNYFYVGLDDTPSHLFRMPAMSTLNKWIGVALSGMSKWNGIAKASIVMINGAFMPQ